MARNETSKLEVRSSPQFRALVLNRSILVESELAKAQCNQVNLLSSLTPQLAINNRGDCGSCTISVGGQRLKACVGKVPPEPRLKSLQEKGLEIK